MKKQDVPCGVCLDLIPLVRDGVASEESIQLVLDHTAVCPSCREALGRNSARRWTTARFWLPSAESWPTWG